MSAAWIRRETSGGFVLNLHVQPGAKMTGVLGLHGEALKIRLAAPPVDGKANAVLIEFLAELLEVPRAQVQLVSGASSRLKRVRVTGASEQAVARLANDAKA